MELTPVKIPGKRRRKGELPIPRKPIIPRRPTKDYSKKRIRSAKPKASYLEKELPLEIMERIFWMSENANFPQSSARIGKLLSGEPTRRATFIHAFSPTWNLWFGVFRDSATSISSYHGWQDDTARFGGNPDFQTALLQHSWADIQFILDSIDSWAQKHARNKFYEHEKLWGDPPTINKLPKDEGGIDNFNSASAYFLHDYDAFCSSAGKQLPRANDRPSWIEVHRETKIPDSLLTGPWDEAAMKKLFWLYRAGARLSDDQTWELTLEGYHNAMTGEMTPPNGTINLPIIRLLFLLGENHWPAHVASSEVDKLHRLELQLRSSGRTDVYQKCASVAAMLLRLYPT